MRKILTQLVWLVNWLNSLWKIVGGFKDKVISLFNTNAPKQTVHGREKKLRKPKTQDQSEENIINSIRSFFILKKEKKGIKYGITKDRIIGHFRTLFEKEKDYYKPGRVNNFWNNNGIEYESNGDRNKSLSLEEKLNRIKPFLRNITIAFKNLIHKKFN